MYPSSQGNRRAFAAVELLAVIAIIAVLLGLGYGVYRGARLSARVALAESNLKQVSTALDLFFQKYGSYPPQGANLVAVLAPYVRTLDVFENPLKEEETQGRTLTELYHEPSIQELDRPNQYVTAFVSEDGSVAVVLKTGSVVERLDGLTLPSDAGGIVAALSGGGTPPSTPPGETGGTTGGETGGTTGDTTPPAGDGIGGDININPNNNDDYEFALMKPDGSSITRDDLHASNGTLVYIGPAIRILFKPKGNGNQNTLTLNGQVYQLENKNRYLILTLSGGSMTVHLYNSKAGKGKAMGKWWMALNATGASISICKCGAILPADCTCGL